MKKITDPEDLKLLHHLINAYRDLIRERYDYSSIQQRIHIPPEIDESLVNSFREYFLGYVYPTPEKREEIEEAFRSLSHYITSPSKMWRLVGNMASAVFRFGRHFPAALKAGFISLESYIDANRFEHRLLQAAKEKNYQIPLSRDQFESCIVSIPRVEANEFVETVYALFKSLTDEELLIKTLEIMESVVQKMLRYPDIYPAKDIDGIRLGMEIIEQGYKMFRPYPKDVRLTAVKLIRENELDYLDRLYEKYR
ncbi:MAG: hypothetical protein D6767_02630 [Candidatus Hydrogenedentota bacterium]|nr:MAG: hypothetical protein D6767_02630 [Candidatus Hydrogenedentota bacterium]